MPWIRRGSTVLVTGVAVLSCAPGTPVELPPMQEGSAVVAETGWFRFHNDARLSLLHLIVGAIQEGAQAPPGLDMNGLPEGAREDWRQALEEVRPWAAKNDLTAPGWVAVRDYLIGVAPLARIGPEGRAVLSRVESLFPTYLDTWWPAHRELNATWIEGVRSVLPEVEDRIVRDIAFGMRTRWPEGLVDVYAVPYGPAEGAYATGEPVVTVVTSNTAARLSDGLEVLFHHAAHAFVLEQSLRITVDDAFEAAGESPPPRLWHSMLFVTVHEAVSKAREETGRAQQRPLGEEIGYYERDERYRRDFEVADRYWRPFLRGELEGTQALRGMVDEY